MLLDMWQEPSHICFSLQNAVTLYIFVLLINRFRSQRKMIVFYLDVDNLERFHKGFYRI